MSMNREQLLRQAIDFFKSESWKTIILEDYEKEIALLRDSLELFATGRDEEDDFMRGRIHEKKKVISMKDIYEKELDELTTKKK